MAVFTGLYENNAKPIHAIQANEFADTAVTTDFYCVYDKQFVVGDDMYRIFDPMVLTPVVGPDIAGLYTSPTSREYIVEVTANGFVNIHHRMPIAFGKLTEATYIYLTNGWRLATALLPDGAMPTTWPIGFGYSIFNTPNVGISSGTENVVWCFNDLYDKANFSTNITLSSILSDFIIAKGLEDMFATAEFFQKMTTDSYTHKYYALGTSIGISKHTDGNNEDVTCRIRILRRQLTAYPCVNLLSQEEPM